MISGLAKLQCLAIDRQLTSFDCCSTLQALTCLNLAGNALTDMPRNLACLHALQQLDVSNQDPSEGDFQLLAPLDFVGSLPDLMLVAMSQGSDSGHTWDLQSLCFLGQALLQAGTRVVINY